MKASVMNPVKAFALIALGLAIAAMGIYVADADDAPGAAVIGILLMLAAVVLGVRTARNRLPIWAARTALAVGVVVAAFAAFLTHAVAVAAPLFAQPPDVPSVVGPAPSPQWAAAVDRARPMVRAAIVEQNLPGVSDRGRHRRRHRLGRRVRMEGRRHADARHTGYSIQHRHRGICRRRRGRVPRPDQYRH